MTTAELIERLRELPSDLRVYVTDYEVGPDDLRFAEHVVIDETDVWDVEAKRFQRTTIVRIT